MYFNYIINVYFEFYRAVLTFVFPVFICALDKQHKIHCLRNCKWPKPFFLLLFTTCILFCRKLCPALATYLNFFWVDSNIELALRLPLWLCSRIISNIQWFNTKIHQPKSLLLSPCHWTTTTTHEGIIFCVNYKFH